MKIREITFIGSPTVDSNSFPESGFYKVTNKFPDGTYVCELWVCNKINNLAKCLGLMRDWECILDSANTTVAKEEPVSITPETEGRVVSEDFALKVIEMATRNRNSW